MIKTQNFNIQGMRQDDIISSGNSSNYAYDIHNLRYNTTGDPNQGFWSVEKSSKGLDCTFRMNAGSSNINATISNIIGSCVINDKYFFLCKIKVNDSTEYDSSVDYDAICVATISNNEVECVIHYIGDIKLSVDYPAECLPCYETDDIQKVYWVDGKNQPRMINIARNDISYTDTSFDFSREVSLNETVTISKLKTSSSMFTSGTVKYAVTYFTKYGQESNIVYDSALYYPIKENRGLNPSGDEFSGDSFKIEISGIDYTHGFDCLRIYSIFRTEENATPVVKVVTDIEIPSDCNSSTKIRFVDNNSTGYIIDSNKLLFVGGDSIIADTIDSINNRLYLGCLQYKNNNINQYIDNIRGEWYNLSFYHEGTGQPVVDKPVSKYYSHLTQLDCSSRDIKYFKRGEVYRFGVQFQDKFGRWSDVIYLKDASPNEGVKVEDTSTQGVIGYDVLYPRVKIELDDDYLTDIKKTYLKVRPVVVYPDNSNRKVLYQGVVSPTVYNKKWRQNNTPYAMSSWFFRPQDDGTSNSFGHISYENNLKYGPNKNTEIQSMWGSDENDSWFSVDRSIVTFNSPEINDESLNSFDLSNVKLRRVGSIDVGACYSKTDLTVSSKYTAISSGGTTINFNGFEEDNFKYSARYPNGFNNNGYTLSGYYNTGDMYFAGEGIPSSSIAHHTKSKLSFPLYPFQRKIAGSYLVNHSGFKINRDGTNYQTIDITQKDIINYKTFSSLKFSAVTKYIAAIGLPIETDDIELFNSENVVPCIVKHGNDSVFYYGNVDSIAPVRPNLLINKIYDGDDNGFDNNGNYGVYCNNYNEYDSARWVHGYSSDQVPITYKSTPHYVLSLKSELAKFPEPGEGEHMSRLHIFELYRDGDGFGYDTSEETLRSHRWIPCGESVLLSQQPAITGPTDDDSTDDGQGGESQGPDGTDSGETPEQGIVPKGASDNKRYILIKAAEGDTYYMRYDCLKTYPFRRTDVNQIVEILSFMVETRINLDGRYDKRRGWLDNTTSDNTNFNLINKGYTQTNDFFTQQYLDKWSKETDNFKNKVAFTKIKNSGDEVDEWTNIHTLSSRDMDGVLGAVTKVKSTGNSMMVFQEHGLSILPDNDRVDISSMQGVPLEIANSTQVGLPQYIDRHVGCQNKWSIISTPTKGLIWIDDSMKSFYAYSEGAKELSALGMTKYLINKLPTPFTRWSPNGKGNFKAYFDKDTKDLLFSCNNDCIAWNSMTQGFTARYDYNNVDDIFCLGDKTYAKGGSWYKLRGGNTYGELLGTVNPSYHIELCVTGDMIENGRPVYGHGYDKVFNTMSIIADVLNSDDELTNDKPFTHISCKNNYQSSGNIEMNSEYGDIPTIVKRFNTWRIQLPRINSSLNDFGDRLRGSHLFIKLYKDSDIKKTVISDMSVSFDIK